MKEIVERYKGKTTPKGHELRVDEKQNEAILWYLYWGEYQGVDDYHHMGIARIRREGNQYVVGLLRATEQQPYTTRSYSSAEEMFAELDREIEAK